MDPPSKFSSSPQLLGILNTPPKQASQVSVPGISSFSSTSGATAQGRTPGSSGQGLAPKFGTGLGLVGLPVIKQNVIVPNIPSQSGDQRPVPILQNVVGTVNLCCDLDLLKINTRTRNSEYNPARFSGVVMRIRDPRTTALLFSSGKIVITGAKSEALCNLAARKYARILQKLGFPVKFLNFRVTNMVATCDLKFPIRVESLNMMHGQFSSYEPELFPGLIYRMVHPRVVLLIFCNGKICFTGAKTVDELHEALENIYPILKSFKKQ